MASLKNSLYTALALTISIRVCTASAEQIRLVGGDSDTEGRVEIFYDGEWGTVCDDDWDVLDALVVCRQLGFTGDFAQPFKISYERRYNDFGVRVTTPAPYPPPPERITLGRVACNGSEARLTECSSDGIASTYCSHDEDAGVACNVAGSDLPTPSSSYYSSLSFDLFGKDDHMGVLIASEPQYSRSDRGVLLSGGVCGMNDMAADLQCRSQGYYHGGKPIYVDQPDNYAMVISWVSCTAGDYDLESCNLQYTDDGYCPSGVHNNGVQCYTRMSNKIIGTLVFALVGSIMILIGGVTAVCYTCKRKGQPSTPASNYQFSVTNDEGAVGNSEGNRV